jgi:pimeloyl-ACP methyl ester carboxylesterase
MILDMILDSDESDPMTTFVLIPGAGGNAGYWDRLVAELEGRGHEAIAVDLPQDDPALGLPGFAALVDDAIGEHTAVVLVAQSLGGFTAPMVRKPVARIVLLNAMIPLPGETPGDWWDNTGSVEARHASDVAAGRSTEFDMDAHFLHDLDDEARAALFAGPPPREIADTMWVQPCRFERWPAVPIHVLAGRGDRFFPADFQQRVATQRLGIDVDLVEGGHLAAVAFPRPLADKLEYVANS